MTSKVLFYWASDVKMTSKVQPAAGYWTVDRENLGLRLCYLKQRAEMAKLKNARGRGVGFDVQHPPISAESSMSYSASLLLIYDYNIHWLMKFEFRNCMAFSFRLRQSNGVEPGRNQNWWLYSFVIDRSCMIVFLILFITSHCSVQKRWTCTKLLSFLMLIILNKGTVSMFIWPLDWEIALWTIILFFPKSRLWDRLIIFFFYLLIVNS